ncbi:hypothetical protein EMPG_15774, partial [Blastomyces silverae]
FPRQWPMGAVESRTGLFVNSRGHGATTEWSHDLPQSCDLMPTSKTNNGRYADKDGQGEYRRPSAKVCPEVGIFPNGITLDTGFIAIRYCTLVTQRPAQPSN